MPTTHDTLVRPRACKTCPFTNPDRDAVCRPGRRKEIHRSVTLEDQTFHCHSEIEYGEDDEGDAVPNTYGARQCAGLTTLLLRGGTANQVMRFAERFGEILTEDDTVPYESLAEWVGDQEAPEFEYTGEPCNTVDNGCTAPAGWGGSGGVVDNADADAEHWCYECGEPVCDACAHTIPDGVRCGYCQEQEEGR